MKLFAFGLGYCACDFIARYGSAFEAIFGTVRDAEKPRVNGDQQVTTFVFDREKEDPGIAEALAQSDVILVSVPPGISVDPVLAKFGRRLAALPQKLTIIYLSTIGVYGDRQGEWVDEDRLPAPKSDRSVARLHAEKAWMALALDGRKTVHILRLAGIYGPGRNALSALRQGKAHRIIKKDQVFNRIHVADISAAIAAVLNYGGEGVGEIWNLSDDEPSPPQDVVTFAASVMGVEPPPEQDIEVANLSALGRTFYGENKRASNGKLKEKLGIALAFPTYREGIVALWEAGEGREVQMDASAENLS
ncbi:MAG TPA: SDR family oxidoreductase [Methylovirgula sp.]|nr:SDR family oxidoreductase [Methylovirgula sp.]